MLPSSCFGGGQSKGKRMIRSIKALSLALVAVAVPNIAVVSGASAQVQGKLTSDGPVTLETEETGTSKNLLTGFGFKMECSAIRYTGHQYGSTPPVTIPSGATTVTVTPHIGQCLVTGGFRMTTDTNGCDYVLHLGETTGGIATTYGVSTDIVCPEGKSIVTTWFEADSGEAPWCEIHVKPQTGIKGAHATDTGNGFIDITGTFEGIHLEKTKSPIEPLFCAASTTKEGKIDIDATVKGLSAIGNPTAISISE